MRGLALRVVALQQNLAKHMQIAAEYPQPHVTTKAKVAVIATTIQTIAQLQRADGGFDAGVMLTRSSKLNRCCLLLPLALFVAGRRQAGMLKDLGQHFLVLRRMKTAIKGSRLAFTAKT